MNLSQRLDTMESGKVWQEFHKKRKTNFHDQTKTTSTIHLYISEIPNIRVKWVSWTALKVPWNQRFVFSFHLETQLFKCQRFWLWKFIANRRVSGVCTAPVSHRTWEPQGLHCFRYFQTWNKQRVIIKLTQQYKLHIAQCLESFLLTSHLQTIML